MFSQSWERTGLVARTVFKIAEAVVRRLVGSIPTRSRHICARIEPEKAPTSHKLVTEL